MTDFRPIIREAYLGILRREPDPGGLEHYNSMMNSAPPATLTEANLRESLIRSVEYAQANPDAPPPPPPSSMSPLRVSGNRFVTQEVVPVKLLGMVVCCDDPNTPGEDEALARGWPLIDERTLDLIAAHKLNYTIMRLGPSIGRDHFPGVGGEGPEFVGYVFRDGKYDLDQWNEAYWQRVRALALHARSRGIYVCYSLIDSWLLDHQLTPWQPDRNHQGFSGGSLQVVKSAPVGHHRRWVRKCVETVGDLENTLFVDGNESFKGHPTSDWVHGIRDVVRAGSQRLFSSNSGLDGIDVDFIVMHDRGLPEPGPLPIVVDEYGTRPGDAILHDAKRGHDGGSVAYIYWRGEHSWAETLRVLAGLKLIAEGGNPVPIPDSCPALTKMGIQPLTWLDKHFNQVPGPVVDGRVNIDLTPKFGSPPRPCNDEHNTRCGGRHCEDPRGGVWELLQAPPGTQTRVENNGFLFRVGPMAAGAYRVRCSPHPDSHDEYGKPHTVSPNAPQELSWTV